VIDQLLARAAGVATSQDRSVLVHGDMHIRHVLVPAAGDATAVVDWGDTALGDRRWT
jgi:aminoglycoside phosphotransferase (APT) family kinase protein